MQYQQVGEPWPRIKKMPLEHLELNQWRLFDPTRSLPAGLYWNRFWNRLTGGNTARDMLRGGFPGSPGAAMYGASEWFRFAAHSVAIRPTADALFQRAINGTINCGGDVELHNEFLGYDANGDQVRYDYTYGFLDLELTIRRWPPSFRAAILQGILLSKAMDAGVSQRTQELLRLATNLLAHDNRDVPERLGGLADECRQRLSR